MAARLRSSIINREHNSTIFTRTTMKRILHIATLLALVAGGAAGAGLGLP
jgi:hypothetical protein